jgi:hypothetical protein
VVVRKSAFSAFPNAQNEVKLKGWVESERLKCQVLQMKESLDSEEFSSVTFYCCKFSPFCEKYFEKEHSVTNSLLLKFFLLKETGSFSLYRRGDIVQSLTHM